jgi:hypothetical protein
MLFLRRSKQRCKNGVDRKAQRQQETEISEITHEPSFS